MAVIFLFIDGVGLGKDTEANPFTHRRYRSFERMTGGEPFLEGSSPITGRYHLFKGIDATLGVEGLPQSGTGQTALFTGKNAAQEIGKHFGPFPHSGIKPMLKEKSIFQRAKDAQRRGYFMNAYPEIFFTKARKRNRWSCTTLMTKSADLRLNTVEEVRQGRAVTAGITQEAWRKQLNIDVPVITPEVAGRRILKMADEKDLILHEYYLTDKAGHSREEEQARRVLDIYDSFLGTIITELSQGDTLILSSDHGNLEDISIKTHTRNKVPLFVKGTGADRFRKVESIHELAPKIEQVLQDGV